MVRDEVALLREAGHEVDVWSPCPDPHGGTDLVRLGVRSVWSLEAHREVQARLRHGRHQVVHIHNVLPMLSSSVIASGRDAGAAVVVTLHNFRLACLAGTLLRDGIICESCLGGSPWSGVVHRCYRGSLFASAAAATSLIVQRRTQTLDAVRVFSVTSRFVRKKLVDARTVDPAKTVIRHNFAHAAELRGGAGDMFVFLGRLSPEKGLSRIVQSWRSRYRLVIVGDGPERGRLEALAAPSVSFLGQVASNDVRRMLMRARALIFPSICFEGSPRAVVEAFAAGVPVVASDIGSLPEHVEHGISGLLVKAGCRDAWRDAVERLEDDNESVRLGAGAYAAWRERFSPQVALRSLEAIYARAIGRAST